ncbi:uncharacterized protein NPIL_598761 [Nephila pilipes]|uniref:DUF7041 domain-containing protein n=1 Tax=Nephila pilipes TaxID=299642 RepID=A0A8X6N5N0_NEPPI|nr:uncharacterized protein NPIL_598761 [Nephila pilipes]
MKQAIIIKSPTWQSNNHLFQSIILRYVRLEAQFDLAKLFIATTKVNYVFSVVESDIINSVSDLIIKQPENGKYEILKKRLIKVHSESETSKIQTRLLGLKLGDHLPSQLTRMRSLSDDNIGNNF